MKSDPIVIAALFRIELRQMWQNRQLRRIVHLLERENSAESQAMKEQVKRLITASIEETRKLKNAIPSQKD